MDLIGLIEQESYEVLKAKAAIAAREGDIARLMNLIDVDGGLLHCTYGRHAKLINIAARASKWECVRFLVERGVDVNVADERRCTPLHYAARGQNTADIIRILIIAGAHVNNKTSGFSGRSPLHVAVLFKRAENAKLLVTLGADFRQRDPACGMAIGDLAGANSHVGKAIKEGVRVFETRYLMQKLYSIAAMKAKMKCLGHVIETRKRKKKSLPMWQFLVEPSKPNNHHQTSLAQKRPRSNPKKCLALGKLLSDVFERLDVGVARKVVSYV